MTKVKIKHELSINEVKKILSIIFLVVGGNLIVFDDVLIIGATLFYICLLDRGNILKLRAYEHFKFFSVVLSMLVIKFTRVRRI